MQDGPENTFAAAVGDFHAAAKPIIEDMLARSDVVSISDFSPSEASAFLERLIDFCFEIDDEVLRDLFTFYREHHERVMPREEVVGQQPDSVITPRNAPAPSEEDMRQAASAPPSLSSASSSSFSSTRTERAEAAASTRPMYHREC